MPRKEEREQGATIEWLDRRLVEEYGDPVPPAKRPDPLDELILTVLSQNTNDRNRDRAYGELRRRFPTWAAVLAATPAEVEDAIRVGGLACRKSLRIQRMLGVIAEREGALRLGRLRRMPLPVAREYLLSLSGVGEKTAAIVLLFSCGRPVFPVDTHVLRLTRRLGLIPARTTADKAHALLGAAVPEEMMYRFHLNLIAHGRGICHPRKPECARCCLRKKCPGAFRIDG
jgi:endonuclease-3